MTTFDWALRMTQLGVDPGVIAKFIEHELEHGNE